MKRRLLKCASVLAAVAFLAVFYGLAIYNTPESDAVKATDFKAGRIIDDAVFYNANTMSVADIQAFLDAKLPTCDMWGRGSAAGRVVNETGYRMPAGSTNADYARARRAAGNTRYHEPPYVCVNKYYENPNTHETLYETNGVVKDGMISAAQIIYNEAKRYNINPQVLLVLLKKESYVWGDSWPLKWEYNTAMGYGCPDHAPCDTQYYGFYNQIHMAAYQFNRYKERNYEYNYHPGMMNNIFYSPDYSCGTKQVYIENMATASLYIYTPYTPNDAALRNYPGTSTCGSYGNRNFFMYFSEWFGSTYGNGSVSYSLSPIKTTLVDDSYYITSAGNQNTDIQLSARNTNNGISVIVSARKNGYVDTFNSHRNTDGTYTFFNVATGKVLDVPNAEAKSGQVIQQYESNGTVAQKWYIYDNGDGSYSISSTIDANLVLANQDQKLTLANYTKTAAQKFLFTPKTQPIADGEYIVSSSINSKYVLDAASGLINQNGTNVQLYGNNMTVAQRWNLKYNSATGYYAITTESGKYLDVSAAGIKDGTNVQIWQNTNSCAQAWQIQKNTDNSYTVLNRCSGKALDLADGAIKNGGNIQIWTRNNTNAQKWKFEEYKFNGAVAEGTYAIKSAGNNSFSVDVSGAVLADATNIQLYANNNTKAQKWVFSYNSTGNYYLIRTALGNKYLSVENASTNSGANVRLWNNAGYCAQRWKISKNTDNTYKIISACSNKVLDVSGAIYQNGTNIQIWDDNATYAQRWVLY